MWQMNEQLKREEEDLCGKRGLEPNTERQTFEMEVPFKFREQYDDVVRPLRQGDVQLQRRNIPNNPSGKFQVIYEFLFPGNFPGCPRPVHRPPKPLFEGKAKIYWIASIV